MPGRGSFDAITDSAAQRLLALPESERWHFIERVGEQPVFHLLMDEAWVTIHRALSDGTLHGSLGEPPLSSAILGDHLVCRTDRDDFRYLKRPLEVVEIAHALHELTDAEFEEKLAATPEADEDATAFGLDFVPQEIEYIGFYFQEMREFYERAASGGFAVLFSWA